MSEPQIDWRAVVDEAIRRRKQDGLGQRDLAALAGVSVPTVNSFEKGETNLRFDRVVAILDALGLFVHPSASDSLQSFVQTARRRWSELTQNLPQDHPSRQPSGHSEQAYSIQDAEQEPNLAELREILARAPASSGWPPFWVPTRASLKPVIYESNIECWLGRPDVERIFADAAHSDFWEVNRTGKAYLQRVYQEDGPDLQPGTLFDVTLPIWRTAEVLLHASWLAGELGASPHRKIQYFARYTGLAGRRLLSWAKPLLPIALIGSEAPRARSDSVDLQNVTTSTEIGLGLDQVVRRILAPLYERFDGFDPPTELFTGQIEELKRNALSGRHHFRAR